MTMHFDSVMLAHLERVQAAVDDALAALAGKYGVRLSTPYPGEHFGEVWDAIQASKGSIPELGASLGTPCKIHDFENYYEGMTEKEET